MQELSDENNKSKRVNWIKKISKCNQKDIIKAIKSQVNVDLGDYQSLDLDLKHDVYPQTDDPSSKFTVIIKRKSQDKAKIEIKFSAVKNNSRKIHVSRTNYNGFDIDIDWNPKTLTCEYMVDDESYKLWEISHKALADILFFDRFCPEGKRL